MESLGLKQLTATRLSVSENLVSFERYKRWQLFVIIRFNCIISPQPWSMRRVWMFLRLVVNVPVYRHATRSPNPWNIQRSPIAFPSALAVAITASSRSCVATRNSAPTRAASAPSASWSSRDSALWQHRWVKKGFLLQQRAKGKHSY